MSDLYVVELTADELETVRAVLARKITARRKPAPRAKAGAVRRVSIGKPPKLGPAARVSVEQRWELAIAEPEAWHVNLAERLARPMGYRDADAVAAAWGLPPVRQRLIDAIAARS